jgi:RNA polymerase sigma-70 factor (ECF subfamily)
MTLDDELKIIRQVLDGDRNAFEELILASQKNVYNLALKMTGNEEDALDISQEAFLKAYRQLSGFRGESRFSVWLYRLTYNICIDFLRKRPRDGVISLSQQDDDGESYDLAIPDMRNLPEDIAIRHETRKAIAKSIGELKPRYREILVMREVTGMSYGEIAETLKLGEGTVKSRLSRARINLVNILVEKGTFPDNYRHNLQKEVAESE